ncbi:MAG TPA: hypothetical protein VGS61_04075 [Acidimicrobiales bacterium]|nr:hypothetical protein [Acidimicrobiales bacterium]
MIDPRFVYLAAALALYGVYDYVRATLRGETQPNRVSWGLWGVTGVLAFVVEVQSHVGLAAVMTLMFGVVPLIVVAASFANPHSVWRIGPFDAACGAVSIVGIVFWAIVHEPTVAIVAFISADQVAALPTIRKSWIAPETESSKVFVTGAINCAITLFTLRHFTTDGAVFPGAILVCDAVISALVVGRLGPRWRATRLRPAMAAR